jgi:hypothetical protein
MAEWLLFLRPAVHLAMHVLVPGLLARLLWEDNWKKAWLIMLAAMLIDVDHLFATPVYAAGRCSISAHPLHGAIPAAIYLLMLFPARLRVLGLGLLVHLALDGIDCLAM